MCQLAGVSGAGFYRPRVEIEPDEEEREVRDALQRIYREHRRPYGYGRVTAELRHRGMRVNGKRVARVMPPDNRIALTQKK
jgi:putative transposase